MSLQLSQEISKLIAAAHLERVLQQDIIEELTVVAGYAYLLKLHPEFWNKVRNHLTAFSKLVSAGGHLGLYQQSWKILAIMDKRR